MGLDSKIVSVLSVCVVNLFLVTGCTQAPLASIPSRQLDTQKTTLGNVQSRVRVGASSEDVIMALSSPNIVTSNPDGTETWVYDKISSESEYATGYNSGVSVKSTRTLIVVIKFNKSSQVESVQYRQTSY